MWFSLELMVCQDSGFEPTCYREFPLCTYSRLKSCLSSHKNYFVWEVIFCSDWLYYLNIYWDHVESSKFVAFELRAQLESLQSKICLSLSLLGFSIENKYSLNKTAIICKKKKWIFFICPLNYCALEHKTTKNEKWIIHNLHCLLQTDFNPVHLE